MSTAQEKIFEVWAISSNKHLNANLMTHMTRILVPHLLIYLVQVSIFELEIFNTDYFTYVQIYYNWNLMFPSMFAILH